MLSPKNKFFGTVDIVIRKRGNQKSTSPTSASGNSIDEVKKNLYRLVELNKHVPGEHSVVIKENKAEYPNFDWVVVEKYTIKA